MLEIGGVAFPLGTAVASDIRYFLDCFSRFDNKCHINFRPSIRETARKNEYNFAPSKWSLSKFRKNFSRIIKSSIQYKNFIVNNKRQHSIQKNGNFFGCHTIEQKFFLKHLLKISKI
jgi:hypothetical protein